MPAVYYGDEFGFAGLKRDRIGGDDDIRPALPDEPPEPLRQYQVLIGLRRRLHLQLGRLEIVSQIGKCLTYKVTPPDSPAVTVTLDSSGAESHVTIVAEDRVLLVL